jgi:hypothetical protein
VSYMGEGRHQESEPARVIGTHRKAAEETTSKPEVCSKGRKQERESSEEMTPLLASRGGVIRDMTTPHRTRKVPRGTVISQQSKPAALCTAWKAKGWPCLRLKAYSA